MPHSPSPPVQRPTAVRAFALPEFMVSLAVVGIVITGTLAGYLFSLRMYALSEVKLDITEDLHFICQGFTRDVRTAAYVEVGQGSATSFIPVTNNALRCGNAIQIYPSGYTDVYVRYYHDPSELALKICSTDDTNPVVMIDSVTNEILFAVEDFRGNITTNEQVTANVAMTIQVYEPRIRGTTNRSTFNQYYQMTARANRRTVLGYQR